MRLAVDKSRESPNRRTLVLMAEAPIPGRVKKELVPPLDYQSAAQLHECFIMDAAEKARHVPDTDFVLSCAPPGTVSFFRETVPDADQYVSQRGKGANVRLANVFRSFAEPKRATVGIGTDVPSLPVRCLELAFDALDSDRIDIVLGPAAGGGCYLVGMVSPDYELLHCVPWGLEESLDACIERAAALGLGWYLLPEWPMVRHPADLSILKRLLLDLPQDTQFAHHTRAYLTCLRDSGKL
jgi:hypothetical protein